MPTRPKPIVSHRLEGTFRPDRQGYRASEREAPGLLIDIDPPAFLTAGQKRLWGQLVKQGPHQVLREADWPLFASYVVHVDTLAKTTLAQADAPLIDGDGKPSAHLRIARQTAELLRQLAGELGMSPIGRVRLGTPLVMPSTDHLPDNPHLKILQFVSPDGRRRNATPPGRRVKASAKRT